MTILKDSHCDFKGKCKKEKKKLPDKQKDCRIISILRFILKILATRLKKLKIWGSSEPVQIMTGLENEGGSIEENTGMCGHSNSGAQRIYTKNSKERLITAVNNSNNKNSIRTEGKQELSKWKKQKWEEKQLYGYFKTQTKNSLHEMSRTWVCRGNI